MRQRNKLFLLLILVSLTLALLIANVFVVSISGYHFLTGKQFKNEALGVSVRTETIPANRGQILGANDVVIATDVKTYNLIAILSDSYRDLYNQPFYVEDKEKTAQELSRALGISQEYVLSRLNEDLYQVEFGMGSRNLSLSKKQEIESLNLPGIIFTESIDRYYPLGNFASNLIGLARFEDVDQKIVGQMGIESFYNDVLEGKSGKKTYQADNNGYLLDQSTLEQVDAQDGTSIYLTLDQGIQDQLENAINTVKQSLPVASNFFGVVMEIETGRILAMTQNPSFDPNNIEGSNFLNHALEATFEPGSTFKSFTYAAAIDSGNYVDGETFDSSGFYLGTDQNNDPYKSWVNTGSGYIQNAFGNNWGTITYDDGFKYSSNVGTTHLLMKMGSGVFRDYIERFKVTEPIQLDKFTSVKGYYNFDYAIEKSNVTFGQGITVSSLSMLQGYTALLNDGIMTKPYFIEKMVNSDNEVVFQHQTEVVGNPIKPSTSHKLIQLMRKCVEDSDGTCHEYNIETSKVISKTGTAQISGPNGYRVDEYINSVITALPYEDPKVMVYFGFQGPLTYFDRSGINNLNHILANRYDPNTAKDIEVVKENPVSIQTIPSLVNHTMDYVNKIVSTRQFKIVKLGQGDQVVAQAPLPGNKALNNQQLMVLTNDTNWLMPDMTDWTIKDLTNFWSLTSIEIETKGSGRVVEQSINIGEAINKETKIKVILK